MVVTIKQVWVLRNLPSIVILDVFPCKGLMEPGELMFRSNRTEAKLRKAKMLSLFWPLMTTTKLVHDVWIEIISMEILHTNEFPFSLPLCNFSSQKCSLFLSACSKKPLVISSVKDGFNSFLSVSRIMGILQYDDDG